MAQVKEVLASKKEFSRDFEIFSYNRDVAEQTYEELKIDYETEKQLAEEEAERKITRKKTELVTEAKKGPEKPKKKGARKKK